MKKGKRICEQLREIRVAVARENDIDYTPAECHHEGDCAGTCPRCEAEVRYLEQALSARRRLGKAAAVASIALATSAFTSCTPAGGVRDSDRDSCKTERTVNKVKHAIDVIEGDDGNADPRHSEVGNYETDVAGYMEDEPIDD